jgi:hypothetical protein
MAVNGHDLPADFVSVSGVFPDWLDVSAICRDAKRYVGLYAVANFDVVAINSGQCVYTTSDRNGEFRRSLKRLIEQLKPAAAQSENHNPTLVYDCEHRREWLAPRESAVKFLYGQFAN